MGGGPVAPVGKRRDEYRVLVQKEGCHPEDNSIDGDTVLNWIFKESVDPASFGLIWLSIGINGGLL
jgi:hypothetical protein